MTNKALQMSPWWLLCIYIASQSSWCNHWTNQYWYCSHSFAICWVRLYQNYNIGQFPVTQYQNLNHSFTNFDAQIMNTVYSCPYFFFNSMMVSALVVGKKPSNYNNAVNINHMYNSEMLITLSHLFNRDNYGCVLSVVCNAWHGFCPVKGSPLRTAKVEQPAVTIVH